LPSIQAASDVKVKQLGDGSILCLFAANTTNNATYSIVAKLDSTGAFDSEFGAGASNQGNDQTNYDFLAMRLNADGNIDSSFGVSGKTYVAFDEGGTQAT
jgi:Domain of unknown function (DUF5122) beta-propeller